MAVYYNEFDPETAQWLRNLIASGHLPDGEVDTRSIEDVQPEDLEGYVQHHFFAGIGGWPFALRLAGWPEDRPVWTGSPPCFTSGHLVLAERGLIPIEEVRVGDLVWTHRSRWKPVVRIGSAYKAIGVLSGQGHPGLETTPDHPFLCIDRKIRPTRRDGVCVRIHDFSPPRWEAARSMPGPWWGMPAKYPSRDIPRPPDMTEEEFGFLCGAYVGDGWTGTNRHEGAVVFGLNSEKADAVQARCSSLKFQRSRQRTGVRLELPHSALAGTLFRDFGKFSASKRLPPWLLSAPRNVQEAFLSGWDLTDGTRAVHAGSRRITTVSRDLAIGGRMLLVAMGFAVSLRKVETPNETIIEDRKVRQKDYYVLSRSSCRRYTFSREGCTWFKAKQFTPRETVQRVYNIEVSDDHSYTIDGIFVHNCQPFSVAGKQLGADDPRHLWPHFFRLLRAFRPPVLFGEQVSAAIGKHWLDGVFADLEGEDYSCRAIIVPACSVNAPHRRDRLWLVAETERSGLVGDGVCPGLEGHSGNECETPRRPEPGGSIAPASGDVEYPYEPRPGEEREQPGRQFGGTGVDQSARDAWATDNWIIGHDGKARRVPEPESGICLLVDGVSPWVAGGAASAETTSRQVALKGFGNAIVPEVAAELVKAYLDVERSGNCGADRMIDDLIG